MRKYLVLLGTFVLSLGLLNVFSLSVKAESGPLFLEERSTQKEVVNPFPKGLNNLITTGGTPKVLIVTEGHGPITGYDPWQDKDFWLKVLNEMGGFDVDWYNGIPSTELLMNYDLVIYTAGGYWYPLDQVINPLREYHFAGKPLIVVAPDINFNWWSGVPEFSKEVLHIEGALGIMPSPGYYLYANTGHPITLSPTKLPNEIYVPEVNSYPDCFNPASDAEGVLTQGYMYSEFGVGSAANYPSYTYQTPEPPLYGVVAYPGSATEGRVVTFGFVPAGLDYSIGKSLAENTINYAMGKIKRILPKRAVELAGLVKGAPYYQKKGESSTKGYVREKEGYYFFTSEEVKNGYPGKKPGLDCSGLSFWSYNKAYYGDAYEKDRDNFPIYYEGANGQYKYNVSKISKEELEPGDLLFFDEYPVGDNVMNHVAMYIGGPFEFKYKKDGEDKIFLYNTIEATAWGDGIITVAFYDVENETLTTFQPSTGKTRVLTVDGYGRVKEAEPPKFKVTAKSPVDLIIIAPDRERIDKEIFQSPTMEYQIYDVDGDGRVDDVVVGGEVKIGDYQIQVVPEPDALPSDTYSLEVMANGKIIILAKDVPISEIPQQPYLIQSTETGIKAAPVANINGPYSGNEGSPITFDGSGSYDPDGTIVSYEWDLDCDGQYDDATGVNPSYTWGDDYSGCVGLKVTDNDGLTAIATTSVTVNNVAPTVEAGADQEVFAGDTVSFSGSFTDPGWLDTHTIVWDFGDGSVVTGTLTPTHVYYNKGTYTVTLTVTDDDGGVGSDTLSVTVKPIPATIDCDPDTLNLKSNGEWITCYIELPSGYDVRQIDGSTVSLNGIPAYLGKEGWAKAEANESNIMDHDGDGILERMVKFDRNQVQAILNPGTAVLTLTGKVFYNLGLADFEGKDTIRVIK
jgi:chitodextrinase